MLIEEMMHISAVCPNAWIGPDLSEEPTEKSCTRLEKVDDNSSYDNLPHTKTSSLNIGAIGVSF